MSRECNERMWNLAYRLAHCGEHRNYQAIEWELQAYGYPQARQLLYPAPRERPACDMRRGTEVSDQGNLTFSINTSGHHHFLLAGLFSLKWSIRYRRRSCRRLRINVPAYPLGGRAV